MNDLDEFIKMLIKLKEDEKDRISHFIMSSEEQKRINREILNDLESLDGVRLRLPDRHEDL